MSGWVYWGLNHSNFVRFEATGIRCWESEVKLLKKCFEGQALLNCCGKEEMMIVKSPLLASCWNFGPSKRYRSNLDSKS